MGVICHLALRYWCMEWYPHQSGTHLCKCDLCVFCIPKEHPGMCVCVAVWFNGSVFRSRAEGQLLW